MKDETSAYASPCDAPQMQRCLGMIHGSMNRRQCGKGYEGSRCSRCAKGYFGNPSTGACEACWAANDNNSTTTGGDSLDILAPFLWLAFGMFVGLGVIGATVFYVQRSRGGTLVGGLFRSMDFMCYVIILFQTTLYVANDATQVVVERFKTEEGWLLSSFFNAINVFQLDFSYVVKTDCLGNGVVQDYAFEQMYSTIVCILVLVYLATVLILPRSKYVKSFIRGLEGSKLNSAPSSSSTSSRAWSTEGLMTFVRDNRCSFAQLLYGQFTYRLGLTLVLLYAVSCKIALSHLWCSGVEGDAYDTGDLSDCRRQSPAVSAGFWMLFLIHGVAFPVATCLGAAYVRGQQMGGSCCRDTAETVQRQLKDKRATGEVALWRYFLDYDFKAAFHWFRAANMAVLLVLVWTESWMKPSDGSTVADRGESDLARSCIQAAAVITYLVLLGSIKPYVQIDGRYWKFYVCMFNQITSLVLIVARMSAEYARSMIAEDPPSFALPTGGLGGSAGLVGLGVARSNLVNATANATANATSNATSNATANTTTNTTGTATAAAAAAAIVSETRSLMTDEQRPVFVASLVLM